MVFDIFFTMNTSIVNIFILVYLVTNIFYLDVFGCGTKRISCLSKNSYKFCFIVGKMVMQIGNAKYCPKNMMCDENKGTLPCLQETLNFEILAFTTAAVETDEPEEMLSTSSENLLQKTSMMTTDPSTISSTISLNLPEEEMSTLAIETTLSTKPTQFTTYLEEYSEEGNINLLTTDIFDTTTQEIVTRTEYTPISETKPLLKFTPTTTIPTVEESNSIEASTNFEGPDFVDFDKDWDTTPLISTTSALKIPIGTTSLGTTTMEKLATVPIRKQPISTKGFLSSTTVERSTPIIRTSTEKSTFYTPTTSTPLSTIAQFIAVILPANYTKNVSNAETTENTITPFWKYTLTSTNPETEINATNLEIIRPITTTSTEPTTKSKCQVNTTTVSLALNLRADATITTTATTAKSIAPNSKVTSALNFKDFSTATTNAAPSLKGNLPICTTTGRFAAKVCNQYYECVRIMWWLQRRVRTCRFGEAFNSATLTCRRDSTCLGL